MIVRRSRLSKQSMVGNMFAMLKMTIGLFLMASATTGLGLQIVMGAIGLGLFMWSFVEMAKNGAFNED